MRTDADHHMAPSNAQPRGVERSAAEPVDMKDVEAVNRAIALHQAGTAVFTVPFASMGDGTLTWLDPRGHDIHAQNGDADPAR
jgi:hypothetical protein